MIYYNSAVLKVEIERIWVKHKQNDMTKIEFEKKQFDEVCKVIYNFIDTEKIKTHIKGQFDLFFFDLFKDWYKSDVKIKYKDKEYQRYTFPKTVMENVKNKNDIIFDLHNKKYVDNSNHITDKKYLYNQWLIWRKLYYKAVSKYKHQQIDTLKSESLEVTEGVKQSVDNGFYTFFDIVISLIHKLYNVAFIMTLKDFCNIVLENDKPYYIFTGNGLNKKRDEAIDNLISKFDKAIKEKWDLEVHDEQ